MIPIKIISLSEYVYMINDYTRPGDVNRKNICWEFNALMFGWHELLRLFFVFLLLFFVAVRFRQTTNLGNVAFFFSCIEEHFASLCVNLFATNDKP